jgi:hypothetical protein
MRAMASEFLPGRLLCQLSWMDGWMVGGSLPLCSCHSLLALRNDGMVFWLAPWWASPSSPITDNLLRPLTCRQSEVTDDRVDDSHAVILLPNKLKRAIASDRIVQYAWYSCRSVPAGGSGRVDVPLNTHPVVRPCDRAKGKKKRDHVVHWYW